MLKTDPKKVPSQKYGFACSMYNDLTFYEKKNFPLHNPFKWNIASFFYLHLYITTRKKTITKENTILHFQLLFKYMKQENSLLRSSIVDHRPHVCLYFIPPTGHGLRYFLTIRILYSMQVIKINFINYRKVHNVGRSYYISISQKN